MGKVDGMKTPHNNPMEIEKTKTIVLVKTRNPCEVFFWREICTGKNNIYNK